MRPRLTLFCKKNLTLAHHDPVRITGHLIGECYSVVFKKSRIINISPICFHLSHWKNCNCKSSSEKYLRNPKTKRGSWLDLDWLYFVKNFLIQSHDPVPLTGHLFSGDVRRRPVCRALWADHQGHGQDHRHPHLPLPLCSPWYYWSRIMNLYTK